MSLKHHRPEFRNQLLPLSSCPHSSRPLTSSFMEWGLGHSLQNPKLTHTCQGQEGW